MFKTKAEIFEKTPDASTSEELALILFSILSCIEELPNVRPEIDKLKVKIKIETTAMSDFFNKTIRLFMYATTAIPIKQIMIIQVQLVANQLF